MFTAIAIVVWAVVWVGVVFGTLMESSATRVRYGKEIV